MHGQGMVLECWRRYNMFDCWQKPSSKQEKQQEKERRAQLSLETHADGQVRWPEGSGSASSPPEPRRVLEGGWIQST